MNVNCYKLLLSALLLVFTTATAYCQRRVDSLNNQISLYGIKNQSPILFIHFDKNVYASNEDVWFTAYLLNVTDYWIYNILSVALVKDDDRSVVLENKFVLKHGLAFGNTTIPDSIPSGNYSFIATANRLLNGQPDVVFIQPVTIKSEDQQRYTASLNPIDTSLAAAQQKVMLLVGFTGGGPPPSSVPATYYVGNIARPVLTGFIKTKAGQYVFNIPSKLLSQGNNTLHVQIQYKGEDKELSLALPAVQKPAIVGFYPEGGNLVNNIQSIIGWEVKSAAGEPLQVNALLYENKKAIDTITTNSYGLGKFNITPKAGSSYAVKLYGINKQDTLYQLPVSITQGPAISLPQAVVNDTLTVSIKDNRNEKLYLIGHNYKQLLFATPVNMTVNSKRIKFIIKDIPKGLAQLTLTDSMGHPFAERTFFAHYNKRTPVSIVTDKSEYKNREKVNVKIRLNTPVPDSGFVSVACVQENRIELKKRNDIESYFYLKHDLGELPVRETYLANTEADKNFLENILLIKGWSRYKWTDVLQTKPADTLRRYTELAFKGNVTRFDQPLDKPVALTNMNRPVNLIISNKTGAFTLSNNDLLTDSGKRVKFMIMGPDPKTYNIHLADPYTDINELLAGQLRPKDYSTPTQQNTRDMQLADNEKAIHLKEVKINGNNDNSFFGMQRGTQIDLGDQFAVTNEYKYHDYKDIYIENYIMLGFTTYMLYLNGIDEPQEFYPLDYSKKPTEEQYLSTLYWKHLLKISSGNNAELSFYTGDITGKFKIVIQGVTGNEVTYGETTFNVTKPK